MLIPENGVWTIKSQVPTGAKSGILYSVDPDYFNEACEAAATVTWESWARVYGSSGEPLEVIVRRAGPNDYGTVGASEYVGVHDDSGSSPPYQYFTPYLMKEYNCLNTKMTIQNSGDICTSIWIYYREQGTCQVLFAQHIEQIAPGEAIRIKLPNTIPQPFLGSGFITANAPLGIVVDQTTSGQSECSDRGSFLSYEGLPYTGDLNWYVPMAFREISGWETSIQIQNMTRQSLPAFITADFMNSSGGKILFVGDWVSPYCSTTVYVPGIVDLGSDYTGGVEVQAHTQVDYPGNVVNGQLIGVVVDLKFQYHGEPSRLGPQAGSYVAHAQNQIQGVNIFACPLVSKGHQSVTSQIGIRNHSNCNKIRPRINFYDETGGLVSSYVLSWLHPKQIRLLDLETVGGLVSGWMGNAKILIEEGNIEQLCDVDTDGHTDEEPLLWSPVVINQGLPPGDHTGIYGCIALSE
ncbi:MAG: hypothetical protein ISS87_01150 [Candidatus Pacebacteria bacterium]|nr:hypothetical protein [Candidatus Paceibacterota bacterium]